MVYGASRSNAGSSTVRPEASAGLPIHEPLSIGQSGRPPRRLLGSGDGRPLMCRNIKPLFNFEPPATDDEVRASSLQFVRKVSGFTKPSKANEDVFNQAVDEVTAAARKLIASLVTTAPPKDRDEYVAKLRERSAERYGPASVNPERRVRFDPRRPAGRRVARGERHRRQAHHRHRPASPGRPGSSPKSSVAATCPPARASSSPPTMPSATSSPASRRIIDTTWPAVAPSAMRMPISLVRLATRVGDDPIQADRA